MSAWGRVNRRSVVRRSASFSGCRYRRSVGSSAARVSLLTRSARLSGCFLMRAIRSLRPTIRPACGPPSSLSPRSEEHTSELQSPCNLVCRLLLEKKKSQDEHTAALHRVRVEEDDGGEMQH